MKGDFVVLYLMAIVSVAYFTFVFSGESFNPFVKPRQHIRRRVWHFGRRLAAVVFLAGGVAFFSFLAGLVSWKMAGLLGLVCWLFFAVPMTLRYRKVV